MSTRDRYFETPFSHSVRDNDLAAVAAELSCGVDPDSPIDTTGWTALIFAAARGHYALAKLLIEAGASTDLADRGGWTALHFACQSLDVRMAELLLNNRAQIDAQNEHGATPLAIAVLNFRDDPTILTLLLSHGADKDRCNKYGQSPAGIARLVNKPNLSAALA